MEKILVIPGSESQIPLIQKVHKEGYEVVCINPCEDSPGFEYADYCIMEDALNKEAVLDAARKYTVSGVISDECDVVMPVVAYVGEQMNLHTLSSKDAELYTDKYQMRKFCETHCFNYPAYAKCRTVKEACDFFESIHCRKMMIKPLDSNSSRGVYKVSDENEIMEYFEKAIHYSRKEKAIICETYIGGTEFTVDGIVIGGRHYSLAVSQKKHYAYNANIAYELFFSYANPDCDYEVLKKINDKYVETTGLKMGFTHAEYKYENGEFYLIEIGARGGGNFISSHIVNKLVDMDTYKVLIDQSTGKNMPAFQCNVKYYQERCVVLHFFDITKNGTVTEVKGEEILSNSRQVILYKFRFKIGDTLKKADDDSMRVGFYIAYGETREELEEFMKVVEKKVNIVIE